MMEKFDISLDQAINKASYRDWVVNNPFEITIQLIDRLQRLHSKGYIHGDIKPQNMCLQGCDGGFQVCLIDFGLATPF